jgi:hypothetical protein
VGYPSPETSARSAGVLIHSAFADSALGVAALVAGADGLLGTRALGEELCGAIREPASGRRYLPKVESSVALAMRSQLRPSDQAMFGMPLAGFLPDEIVDRLAICRDELDHRRGIMLLALGPAAPSVRGNNADAPLDYEWPRRRFGHGVT